MNSAATSASDRMPPGPPGSGRLFSESDEAAIRMQLEKIIASKLFRDTTRMKRFLRYVTEQALEGRADRLKGYTIGVEVFDRSDDFDPQADTIVRVQAGQLRRRLDLYYADEGTDDPVRLTVPKGRYAPSFEFRSPPDPDAAAAAGPKGVLTLLNNAAPQKQRPGVAVLTLEDLTDADKRDFFAEGLTAEIVGDLVQFRHIRVVTVRATAGSRTTDMNVREIGKQFDTQFVLSGNVRRVADVFRVAVHLIDTRSGQVVFSRTFDRQYTPDNLFEIQESIASHVAAAVAAPFGQINRYNWRKRIGRRESISAYEAVLRFYGMGLSPQLDLAEALIRDVEAITADHENFSTGFAIRAMLHVLICTQCIPAGDERENFDAAQALAERSVVLDSQNALGYFALFQAHYHDGNLDRADSVAQRAIALNPNDYTMLAYFAIIHANRGELELSEAFEASARRLIGTPPRWFEAARLGRTFRKRDFETVLAEIGDVRVGDTVSLWFLKLASLGHAGRAEEGRAFFKGLSQAADTTIENWKQTHGYWQPDDEMQSLMYEGWRKVGLDI